MKNYFESPAESLKGAEGKYYFEVENGLITRQINIIDGIYYWATPTDFFNEEYDFTDQPEYDESDQNSTQITKEEFEAAWIAAINQER